MARYGLDLQQKNKSKFRQSRALVIAFLCFSIVLGSVSMLLLWRSLNYDFNNIFVKDKASTTVLTTETETEPVVYEGNYAFLIAVTTDDGKMPLFFNLIGVNLSEKTIRVVPVNGDVKDPNTKMSCSDTLVQSGIAPVISMLNSRYDVKIRNYAILTDSGYKSFFKTMGSITMKIGEKVRYDTADMFLELSRGENTLTPDKIHKYMKYICETKKGYERSKANADIVVAAFQNYCTIEKFSGADSIFSVIINYCTTDISIVDFVNAKDEIEYLIPKSQKEKLKVFVSDNISGDSAKES